MFDPETLHIGKSLRFFKFKKQGLVTCRYFQNLDGMHFKTIFLHDYPGSSEEADWLNLLLATKLRAGGKVIDRV